ncbi:restriction endonuclease [Noviherbaspirillum sedimenti]|uniref:Mrr restriction system protein n=1 Tax=Noviherbaspirillum sedimenti TaxID=2320865 RepID=A0A3A3GKU5_9BURK|nr:restriction endonuclease [Noviherbaspirillum sedimenti]RJG02876.1 Mrr restriction system protein [Noviherbaspirillum sedimenti]
MAEVTRKRTGELLRKLFEILLQSQDGLQAGVALKKLADSVTLSPYEAGIYESSGDRRFEKIVRFATVDCVKAGWILKHKGTWTVTVDGVEAYNSITDPESFYKSAVKLYDAWKASQKGLSLQTSSQPEFGEEDSGGKSTSITFEQAEEQAWTEIEMYLLAMNPYEFQDLVADLLKAMSYHVSWVSPPGKDGGVDILAYNDPLGTVPPRIKVQVKRVTQRISTDTLRAFTSLIGNNDVGLFVSTGGFTKDAEEFARAQESRKVTLIDLDKLVELWIEFYGKLEDSARRRLPLSPIYFLTPPA